MRRLIPLVSWVLYDFSNTMFTFMVVVLYFPWWITRDAGKPDLWVGAATAASAILVVAALPLLGVWSDAGGRKRAYLAVATVGCCAATALMGSAARAGLPIVVTALYVLANLGYHAGMVFYNALLPGLAPVEKLGRVSGYGVAAGYAGAIGGLAAIAPIAAKWGKAATFAPTAALFLLFALPCLLWVRDTSARGPQKSVGEAYAGVWRSLRSTREHPGVARFLLAKYFYEDAIATVYTFMAVYGTKGLKLSDTVQQKVLAVATVFAIAGALAGGFVTDRLGAKRTLLAVLGGWIVFLSLSAAITNVAYFWVIGPVLGVLLGALWTSSRPLFVALVPKERLGEFFAVAELTGKTSAVVGPLLWGVVVLAAAHAGFSEVDQYRLAIASLVLQLVAGFVILLRVPAMKAA